MSYATGLVLGIPNSSELLIGVVTLAVFVVVVALAVSLVFRYTDLGTDEELRQRVALLEQEVEELRE